MLDTEDEPLTIPDQQEAPAEWEPVLPGEWLQRWLRWKIP